MCMDKWEQSSAEPRGQHAADIGIFWLRLRDGGRGFLSCLALGFGKFRGAGGEFSGVGNGGAGFIGGGSGLGVFLLRDGEPPLAEDSDGQRQSKKDATLRHKQRGQRVSPAKNAARDNGVIVRQVCQRS